MVFDFYASELNCFDEDSLNADPQLGTRRLEREQYAEISGVLQRYLGHGGCAGT